jgi:hypothetical protein
MSKAIGIGILSRIAVAVAASISVSAFAQTQPTRPSALATLPTMHSAWATAPLSPCRSYGLNPTSPCYSGALYPGYSAVTPFEFPKEKSSRGTRGTDDLNEDQAKSQIEAKGYRNISKLHKDGRGIWRGEATTKDGKPVDVILDLEGNIYSQWSRLEIRIEPPRSGR